VVLGVVPVWVGGGVVLGVVPVWVGGGVVMPDGVVGVWV
jgi:hypothetical protein